LSIELVTFGGLHILDDEAELDWLAGQRSRAALLVYLAVEGRVSREALTTVFWPESDAENARHALRQGLYQIKKAVRADWVESLAHDLAVTEDVRVDVHAFTDAIARADLNTAVRLYRGPFLDGVHLVDLTSWEGWVDSKRAHYSRAFRKASRDLLESKRASHDIAGAITVAEHWVSKDRLDDEAQRQLIEALFAAGERTESIRQYETYLRLIAGEGLDPSDEVRALGDRIHSQSVIAPSHLPAAPADDFISVVAALPGEPRRRSSKHLLWMSGAALAVILAGFWIASRARDTMSAASRSIVVLPFSIHGSESVSYLREGMVSLLTAALDGAGSVRPVDARATFAAADLETDPDKTARQLDAGMYLLGDVTEAAGKIQLDAAVYKRGERAPMVHAVVSGKSDSIFVLADRLSAQLLAGLSDPAADRLIRTASVTTSSLPAFKEYLEGDRLMREGQFERAAEAYIDAIAHDSTFAVAYYRLGLAREWAPLPGEDSAAAAAAHFASRLSSRDRTLLEAFRLWRSGRASEADRAYRAILARYPDDVDAWFQLAEIQFHQGPLIGQRVTRSEHAWRKVLSYEPRNLFAVTHLARIAVVDRQAASLDSLLAPFSPAKLRTDRRLVELELLRAIARGDRSASAALVPEIRKWEGLAAWRVAVFLTAFTGEPASMRPVISGLTSPAQGSELRADILWFASLLDLATGRISASRETLSTASAAEHDGLISERRHGFDAVTEWFAGTLPLPYSDTTLSRVRESAESWKSGSAAERAMWHHDTGLGTTIQMEPLRNYTLGLAALRLKDTIATRGAAARLSSLAKDSRATSLTRDLDRGLRARIAYERGDYQAAIGILATLECRDVQGDIAATPFAARVNERFLRGEALVALKRDREALDWFASLGDGSVTEVPLKALSHFRQAEIHTRLHNPREATDHYTRVVQLWATADVQFQPMVKRARERLVELKR
jgi:DNA-binding SARP family transcriptional activator/TolB-like protein